MDTPDEAGKNLTSPDHEYQGPPDSKWFMLNALLASLAVLFAATLVAIILIRRTVPDWPPEGQEARAR